MVLESARSQGRHSEDRRRAYALQRGRSEVGALRPGRRFDGNMAWTRFRHPGNKRSRRYGVEGSGYASNASSVQRRCVVGRVSKSPADLKT